VCPQRAQLGGQVLGDVHRGGDDRVVGDRQLARLGEPERQVGHVRQRGGAPLGRVPRGDRVVDAVDVRDLGDSRRGDVVDPDVVGVAVAAELVVGDDDLRLDLAQHVGEGCGLLLHGALDEGSRVRVGRDVDHAGVAPAADAAEEAVVGDTQCGARGSQLRDAVAAQLVGGVGGQFAQACRDDLALFAEGAGDHSDVHAERGIAGDRAACPQTLVIGMRVDQQQPWWGSERHRISVEAVPQRHMTASPCCRQGHHSRAMVALTAPVLCEQ
jgi:hypothetical protein